MRWLTIAAVVLGLALVGAGCGGGDDEAASDESITITTEETTDTDETTEDTTEDTETSGSIGDLTEDCLAAVSAFAALGQAVGAASGGTDADESAEAFSEFADKAPDEIEDDIRVIAAAYSEYIQELSSLDLQAGEQPSAEQLQQLTEASQALATPEVTAASESFNAWATANCPR